jgi:hypothetical protein
LPIHGNLNIGKLANGLTAQNQEKYKKQNTSHALFWLRFTMVSHAIISGSHHKITKHLLKKEIFISYF